MSWGIRIMRGGNNSSKKDLNGFLEWGLDGFFIGINHQRWHGKSWQQQQINSRIFLKNWFSWFFFYSWQIGMACRIICYPGFNNSFSNIFFVKESIKRRKDYLFQCTKWPSGATLLLIFLTLFAPFIGDAIRARKKLIFRQSPSSGEIFT